jgi:GNAT superfamily N-acetyltransferase
LVNTEIIRLATIDDINDIVYAHLECFPNFFLSKLGKNFLTVMYTQYILDTDASIYIMIIDDKIVGFLASIKNPVDFYRRLKKTKWNLLMPPLFKFVFKQPIYALKKIYEAIFYKGDSEAILDKAVLLSSFCLIVSHQRLGLGSKLLKYFEGCCKSSNFNFVYLTTDANDNHNVNLFYEKNSYFITKKIERAGGRIMNIRVKELK